MIMQFKVIPKTWPIVSLFKSYVAVWSPCPWRFNSTVNTCSRPLPSIDRLLSVSSVCRLWSACACFDKAVVKSSTFAGSVETRQRWPTPLTLPELYKVTVGRPIAHCFSVKLKWKLDPPFLLWNNKKRKRCCVSLMYWVKVTHVLSAGKTQGGTLLISIIYVGCGKAEHMAACQTRVCDVFNVTQS